MTQPVPQPNLLGYPDLGQAAAQPVPGPAAEPPAAQVPATFQPQGPVPLPAHEQPTPAPAAPQAPGAVPIPEGGYARRFIDLPLPEFNLPGINCVVRLRNPGMMSQGAFEELFSSIDGIQVDANGEPVLDIEQAKQALPRLYGQLMNLIASWRMWDATSAEDVPPLLPSPPTTVEDLKRAPAGAMKRILDAVQELKDPQ
jgi:hypothetical protein